MAKLAVPKRKTKQTKDQVEVITLSSENFDQFSHFCGRSKKYAQAYDNESNWLESRFKEGMRYKLFMSPWANGWLSQIHIRRIGVVLPPKIIFSFTVFGCYVSTHNTRSRKNRPASPTITFLPIWSEGHLLQRTFSQLSANRSERVN